MLTSVICYIVFSIFSAICTCTLMFFHISKPTVLRNNSLSSNNWATDRSTLSSVLFFCQVLQKKSKISWQDWLSRRRLNFWNSPQNLKSWQQNNGSQRNRKILARNRSTGWIETLFAELLVILEQYSHKNCNLQNNEKKVSMCTGFWYLKAEDFIHTDVKIRPLFNLLTHHKHSSN